MIWRVHQVVFRLRSPLHIGCGKVGNLQRTRSYVTGRALWGALTMRLTRDAANGSSPAMDSQEYLRVGEELHNFLAYTYFYLATERDNGYEIAWPWEKRNQFRRRFLTSYASTALSYPQQSAAEGMLHEVEFISPRTLDTGAPVFLIGYVFETDDCRLDWKEACKRLQMGGERGYGWGDVGLISISATDRLFDGKVVFKGGGDEPLIHVPPSERLLAHVPARNLPVVGEVEPLVGREWRSDNTRHRYAGQHVAFGDFCFTPGSTVTQYLGFLVGKFGVWQWHSGVSY